MGHQGEDSGHNGHKPKWPKPKRPQTETATNRNGHRPKRSQTETATNRNGHNPERPQTESATNRNGHKPKWPQTGTATNRNGHKRKRPQTGMATNRNSHNYIWFSGLQTCVLNRSCKLMPRSRQKQHSLTSEHGYGARIWIVTVDSICAWGNISIHIFKIWIRFYISVTSWCVLASPIITLKSRTTRLFCFQKFVHDNPQKFRHNGLWRGESIGRRWFPGPVMWKVFPRHDIWWLHTSVTGICETIYTW